MFYPTEQDSAWMRLAIEAARRTTDDVPVGAVIVVSGRLVGEGWNRRESDRDPTAHAEIVALRQAGLALGRWNLEGSTLYVTVEPCAMCAGAIWQARVSRVVYGVPEPQAGAVHSRYELLSDGRCGRTVAAVGGCCEDECRELLRAFFRGRRLQAERCESG